MAQNETEENFQWVSDGIPDECKTNLNLERLKSHLVEFFESDFDLSTYMDCVGKNLNDALMVLSEECRYWSLEEKTFIHPFMKQLKIVQKKMRFLRYLYVTEINDYVNPEKMECLETQIHFMANNVGQLCLLVDTYEDDVDMYDIFNKPPYLLSLIVLVELEMKKIFLSELKDSKFTQSKTFKDKKLPKGFSDHLHSLLMYLRNKKLENFPAQNIDVAIEFLLVFLDADISNHVINGNWLNEVMEKVGAIVGEVLYVIQKLLPSSINKDDTSKISLSSIQILEKTEELKEEVEAYYKSLKFTPSQFPTVGGLSFPDSLLRKLNEMSKLKSGLDFLMKPFLCNLEKELSALTSILEKELSSLSSIFRDVTRMHHEHKIPKDLQRRTINLACEAEVAIDSILSQYNAFLHIFCSLPTILKEIKQINAEVTEMWSVDVALNPHYVVAPSIHLPTQHSNPVIDEEIVGFGTDTVKLIQYLTGGTSELDVIPIVGMGGQGKTTCARKLYKTDTIVSWFDVQAWCIISQTYNRRQILQDIFNQVTESKDIGDKDDILADKLRKILTGKRYLIVLDDMWDCMVWDDLRFSFPDVGNRSRIVITTRLEKVGAYVMHHTDPYSLPFLTTEESCQLLQKKVFQQEDCPPELQDVSQAVAEKCKGLPLVVVLVAGIIKKRKMEESWWNEVKDALFDYLDRESEEYSWATMQLSFNYLPDCLKPCFLYMGMFPEDAIIPVSKLISLWIAEDFAVNTESAEDYLMDLISSNVVMVSKRSYNGKIKYCQVHDVVLHFCLEKSREEKFMRVMMGRDSQFQPCDWKESRVRFILTEEHSKFASLGSKTGKPFHQHLRSLIMIDDGKSNDRTPFFQIRKLRLLKVLDLSSHSVDYFSSATLKPLNHLKYVAVSAAEFNFHPESRLPHLETLIVKNYGIKIVVLPASFWEMEKLRHVEIYGAEFDSQGLFEESSKLENLSILKCIVRFPTDRLDVLSRRCPNLQQLKITFEDKDSAGPFCLTLENLTQLQILHLSFDLLDFDSLSGLQLPSNLKKLVLRETRIENLNSFTEGLQSLEYLRLRDLYNLQSEEWCLGDITFHNLKFLRLSSIGISRLDASEESFPQLETISIIRCELEEIPLKLLELVGLGVSWWNASEESFPMLEKLVIKGCDKLENIPFSFADIPTLKQIELIDCMKKSLEASAVRIKEYVEENEGNDRIELIIKNY